MLAALVDIPANVGYAAVFAFIAIETMGIPVPGETALIAAALIAHQGEMDIVALVGALYFVLARPDRGVAGHVHDELEPTGAERTQLT